MVASTIGRYEHLAMINMIPWALKMKRGKLNRTKSKLFVVSLIVKIQKVARIANTVHTHVLAKRVKM